MTNDLNLISSFISTYKKQVFIVIVFSIIAACLESIGFSMIIPIANEFLLNSNSSQDNILNVILNYFNFSNSIHVILPSLLILVFLLKSFFSMSNIYLTTSLAWNLRAYYANLLMNKYTNSHYELVIKKKMGTIINAALTETNRAAQAVRYLVELVTKTLLCLALIILLLISNFYLTIIILVIVFFIFLIFKNTVIKFSSSAGQKRLILSQEHTEKCTEMIGAIKEAKILNLQNRLLDSFDRSVSGYSRVNIVFNFFTSLPQVLSEFILVLLFSVALIILSFLAYDLTTMIPLLSLYLIVSIRLIQTFSLMAMLRMRYIGLLPSVKKVMDYLDEVLKQEKNNGVNILSLEGDILIKDLSFSYENNKNILENVNISIPYKKFTGIIGESGSGKSTFINILTSLLFPSKGKILINGINLNDLDIKKWRSKIGYISQSPFLFNDTIYNNILMGNFKASKNEIIEACKLANAFDFINTLPNGFATIVGDRGSALSGGQLQRIAIARGIIRKPDLFIFDECTSALDSDSENLIMKTIEKLSITHTVIVITHKVNILKNANIIYEMKEKKLRKI